jgi:hypothetical protein
MATLGGKAKSALVAGIAAMLGCLGQANAGGSLKDEPAPAATERGVFFTGYDAARGAHYVFDGTIVALNGDLGRDGFVLRAYGSRVDYDLDPGNGRGYQADAMVGYKFSRGPLYGGIYIGVDWQNYKLKPDDPTADIRGTEYGFKVAADLETSDELPYYFGLDGNYSTAFNSYWVRARTGVNLKRVVFGPEGIFMGDDGFDAQRAGGFVTYKFKLAPTRTLDITLSGGFQWVAGNNSGGGSTLSSPGGGEGAYGSIVFSTTF